MIEDGGVGIKGWREERKWSLLQVMEKIPRRRIEVVSDEVGQLEKEEESCGSCRG